MLRKVTKAVCLGLSALMTVSMVSCSSAKTSGGTSNSGSSVKKETLTIWESAFIAADEEKLPNNQRYFTKVCKAFEAANPGVTVNYTYLADQSAASTKLKAAALAGTAPDIVNLYSGYTLTSISDILLDITSLIPSEDKEKISGWDTCSLDMKDGGTIIGYPCAGYELGLLLYNKKLVKAAGVDLEGSGKPKNAEEFVAALKKIKATGVTPIISSDSGFNAIVVQLFATWWAQMDGTEGIASDGLGKTKFADDAGFLDMFKTVSEMYSEGLINKDYLTSKDAGTSFYQGKAAMVQTGNWGIVDGINNLGDNCGIYVLPSYSDSVKYPDAQTGGCGQAMGIYKGTKDAALAVKFCSFLDNRANSISLSKLLSEVPLRKDITIADLGWSDQALYVKEFKILQDSKVFLWADNSLEFDVCNELYKVSGTVVTGKMTPAALAADLDKVAQKAASNS